MLKLKILILRLLSSLRGTNLASLPKEAILDQMHESRPLPMGKGEFDEWANRLISGALIPGGDDNKEIFIESQKFALANMIMHLGPTESHKPDAFFIHSLRKFAVNQVADSVRKELHEAAKARTATEEAALKAKSENNETCA